MARHLEDAGTKYLEGSMQLRFICASVFSVYLFGCASTPPAPFITQMNSETVHVQVPYGTFGPSVEDAHTASLPLANTQCSATGKTAILISSIRQLRGT